MNRCFFIATPGGEGPVAYHFMALGKALAEKGNRVVILIDGQRKEKERHSGNPLIYTWPSKRPVKFRDAYFLFKLIGKFHPDCLMANFGAVNVMMGVGWLRRVATRICWYHTLPSAIAIDSQIPSWHLALLDFRKRWIYKIATHIVPVSEAGRSGLTFFFGVPPGKCHVLHNALGDPFKNTDGRSFTRRGNKTHRIICAARFHPVKAQHILIRAAAILAKVEHDFLVEFVGEGPDKDYCMNLVNELHVNDRCHFFGFLPHQEVLKRMADAYVSVLPSQSENCPLALIESMALGVPAVASRVGGIPEIIRDDIDGFLVPPGDPEALADKLKQLMSNPELRDTMGKEARQRFLERFELQNAVAEQVAWLASLMEKQL